MSVQLGRAVGADWRRVPLRIRCRSRCFNRDRRTRGRGRSPSRIRGRIHIRCCSTYAGAGKHQRSRHQCESRCAPLSS